MCIGVFVLSMAALVVLAAGADAGVSSSGSLAQPTGSLAQTGQVLNKTHWMVEAGDTVNGTITGATDAVVGSGGCVGGVLVTVQSSNFGNTPLCGSLTGSTITFTWVVPSVGVCQTTIVSYNETGNLTNNLLLGGAKSAAGFAIVDSSGNVIPGPCNGGTTSPPGLPLTVSKVASGAFDRKFTWGIQKSVDQTEIDQGGSTATFNYTVSVTHDAGTDSGWRVTGVITVFNPNVGDAIVTVTDAIADAKALCSVTDGENATVPGLSSVAFPYTCTGFISPSGAEVNTGTAAWNAQFLTDGEALAAGSSNGTKSVDWSAVTPNLIDNCVAITDTLGGPLGTVCSTDPSPSVIHYPVAITGRPGTCVTADNTATFTTNASGATGSGSQSVKLCVGADLAVSKTATPSFTRTFTWGIGKDVNTNRENIALGSSATFDYGVGVTHDSGTDSGWQVNGLITVSNPNSWESITMTGVTDTIDNGGVCTITSGDPNATLAANGSTTLDYSCSYALAPSPAAFNNKATASWDAGAAATPHGSASGTAIGAFGAPTTIVDGSVTVTDTLGGSLGAASYIDPSPITFSYPFTFSGDAGGTCTKHDNTAMFTTNTSGATGTANREVTVCVGKDLSVSKTANPSFTRTYLWSIAKSVDKTVVKQVGGTATFNYTVTVSEISVVDSAWQVSGKITLSNPNNWESITADVADALDNGGSCAVSAGTGVSVPASGSVTLNYLCTYASAPSSSAGTNTATASWDKVAYATPAGLATGMAAFAFGAPTKTVNKAISVTDTFNGITNTLGTVAGSDTPPLSQAFHYARTVNVPAFNCVSYTNTATIVETGQSAGKTVTVCGPLKTGALTIGFWQNKNGQAIIAGGSSTVGVCKSGTWLRQFAPFKDLSAAASCSGVAAYFTSMFNAANAGGTSMNPMLKAQMLATAFDVYFSDPSLGGNKIGAPAPIGGVAIDLTDIGGSENVSAAFGGATSMTPLQMLTYAASQSNAGGSVWYGNVKATQGLAKDAFDAINNQAVFGP